MTEKFRAIQISKTDQGQQVQFVELTEADLMEGDVTVAVSHSSVNYKDGLAITGKAPIIRKFPLIPGVDFAGTVTKSSHQELETRRSGYSQWLGCWRTAPWRLFRIGPRLR